MQIEVKIPSPGESISEVEIVSWNVEDGDFVEKDQELAEIESDKASLPLIAEEGGQVNIKAQEGDTVAVGDVVAVIDTEKQGEAKHKPKEQKEDKKEKKEEKEQPAEASSEEGKKEKEEEQPKKKEKEEKPKEQPAAAQKEKAAEAEQEYENVKVSPVARKMMDEHHLSVDDIIKGLQRIGKNEVQAVINGGGNGQESYETQKEEAERGVERKKMSQLRKKLAKRLVAVKNETAMLTTFNEVDMTSIINLRKQYQKKFIETHDIKLGFMSFFTKAVTVALQVYPKVSSQIEGEELVTPNYVDVGIAVQTEKGLMVPVLRNTQVKSLADIEHEIAELAGKARKARLSIEEMTGGTFSITNGGIFGSLLSTPILNPPQAAILGMHNIQERPVAINGKVEVRPMMYLALSYDHRIIDGKDSVTFLVKVKELIENPQLMLTGGVNAEEKLLEI
jgi:2-oxoglutarate dehydrogenase E2 component (dihydrolipoamide succinyltransferase)